MSIYIFLMLLPLILGGLFGNNTEKGRKCIIWGFCIFLLCVFVLRDFSVGRDMPGYSEVYQTSMLHDWFDSEWIYMEGGYIFIMKLCASLGLSFRLFMTLIYSALVIPLGNYIYKSSKDIPLSLIVYVCFQFFVFNMSAFRQTASMGLCLWAFMVAHKNGYKAFIKYFLIVLVAASIHKSSIVFFPAYFLMRQRLTPKMVLLYLILSAFAVMGRDSILVYFHDNGFTSYQFSENLTVGFSFLFTLAVVVFTLIADKDSYNQTSFIKVKDNVFAAPNDIQLGLSNYANLLACSIILLLAFNGSILMRAAAIYQVSILIVLPNILTRITSNSRGILRLAVIFLMFAIFYLTVLIPSQFDIVPYVIGKDITFLQ